MRERPTRTHAETFELLGGESIDIDFALFAESGAMLFEGCLDRGTAGIARGFREMSSGIRAADRRVRHSRGRPLQRRGHFRSIAEAGLADACLRAAIRCPWRRSSFRPAPRPYTIAELAADPIGANNQIGHYSYGANLLDLCAIAVPNAVLSNGVPMGRDPARPGVARRGDCRTRQPLRRHPCVATRR